MDLITRYSHIIAIIACIFTACPVLSVAQPSQPMLIPLPATLAVMEGSFILGPATKINLVSSGSECAQILAEAIERSTGLALHILAKTNPTSSDGTISLRLDSSRVALGDEGYTLEVTPKGVSITAAKNAGLFYGVQTLRQLLPMKPEKGKTKYPLACVKIEDAPRFGWRGYMLDSSRHFITKKTILNLLDALAMFKINYFHWHIVDDQAWRLDIAKYPRLVKPVAGLGNAASQAEGYYSADDIREIVDRAKRLHITIVPEIEMPSHATQAVAVITEGSCLGADGKPLPPGEARVICLGSDKAIAELQDILVETMAMFPNSPVIHLGGDEAHPKRWRVCSRCKARMAQLGVTDLRLMQKWFMNKMSQFVHEHGRTSMAWADKLSLGIPQGQIVHAWHAGELEKAVAEGFRVVQSQHDYTYFDYGQGPGDSALGGNSLDSARVYALNPTGGLTPEQAKLVLGTQAQLWTTYVTDEGVFDKTFPRILALAEVGWTPQEKRDTKEFTVRLQSYLPRLVAQGIPSFKPIAQIGSWDSKAISQTWKELEWDITKEIKKPGPLVVQLQYQRGAHALLIQSATLFENGKEIGRDQHAGITGSSQQGNTYHLQIPAKKGGATYTLRVSVQGAGGTDSYGIVVVR